MSTNFNALLNAVVVATNPTVPAAAGTTGTHAAAVQGSAAAIPGAAAHGAAGVAAGNVTAVAGSGTTSVTTHSSHPRGADIPPSASQPPNTHTPAGVTAGSGPSSDAQPVVGADDSAGQPAAPPGLRRPRGVPLRCTDSTTDLVEKRDNGQFYSLRTGDVVNNPFTQHFPPPSPSAGPSRSHRVGQRATVDGSLSHEGATLLRRVPTTNGVEKNRTGQSSGAPKPGIINDSVIKQCPPPPPFAGLTTFPSVSVASTRPPPPVVLPDILPLKPIVIPIDLFAPSIVTTFKAVTGPAAGLPPSSRLAVAVVPVYPYVEGLERPYYDAINVRAAKARSELAPVSGLREAQPHAHHTTPEDCQALRRWMLYRGRGREESKLILAEALCAENKNQQLIYLQQLREADLLDPPHLRENFVSGAHVAAQFQIARVHALLQLAAAQAAFVASVFFPERPPVPAPPASSPLPPPPPPKSIWSAMAGAVVGILKRKRGADDDSEEHPAKRARVQKEPGPQPRFVFLRRLGSEQPPPALGGAIVETCPEPLPEHGAAAYPAALYTSNVASLAAPRLPGPCAATRWCSRRRPASAALDGAARSHPVAPARRRQHVNRAACRVSRCRAALRALHRLP